VSRVTAYGIAAMEIDVPARIAGDGVVLRELRAQDAPAYAQAFAADPSLGRLLGIEEDPSETAVRQRSAEAAARAREGRIVELVVADPKTDEMLGVVMLHSLVPQHRRGEIGFWLTPQARGRGHGGAAVRALIDWAFSKLDLLRVEMTTTPDNAAVAALADRLGFVHEGVARKRNVERGRRVDVVSYGLLREEWRDGR
jgi:RimJ/RimL family protein N-acetyltransferase